ncbi:MAG: response regulator [Deltaproteobacteria bacterium]|nr:response regulator [Deltaproteobacteria bacterium]
MPALVLIAESDPFNLRLLQEICEAAGHTVLTAMDGGAALETVARKRPDLVLVDVALPTSDDDDTRASLRVGATELRSAREDERRASDVRDTLPEALLFDADHSGGLEVLRLLKSDQSLSSIPVLLTANDRDETMWRRGMELGAEDYLARPYRVFEIHQRVRNTLRRALLERMQREDQLDDALHRAGNAAQLPLTLEYEMTRAIRFDHALACVALACTNLEHVRDAGGDEAAETLMATLIANVRQCVRTIDHVFRAGERELVLVLPETSASEAEVVIHRLEQRAKQNNLAPTGVRSSLTIGVSGRVEGNHACGLTLLSAARRERRMLS